MCSNSLCRVLGSIRCIELVTRMQTHTWPMLPRLWARRGDRQTTLSCETAGRDKIKNQMGILLFSKAMHYMWNQSVCASRADLQKRIRHLAFLMIILYFITVLHSSENQKIKPNKTVKCELKCCANQSRFIHNKWMVFTLHTGTISTEKVLL